MQSGGFSPAKLRAMLLGLEKQQHDSEDNSPDANDSGELDDRSKSHCLYIQLSGYHLLNATNSSVPIVFDRELGMLHLHRDVEQQRPQIEEPGSGRRQLRLREQLVGSNYGEEVVGSVRFAAAVLQTDAVQVGRRREVDFQPDGEPYRPRSQCCRDSTEEVGVCFP
jgi:hypothetical protein